MALCEEFCPDRLTKERKLFVPTSWLPGNDSSQSPSDAASAPVKDGCSSHPEGQGQQDRRDKQHWPPQPPCRGGWGRGSLLNHSALGSCRASQGLSDPPGRIQGPSSKFSSFISNSPCLIPPSLSNCIPVVPHEADTLKPLRSP